MVIHWLMYPRALPSTASVTTLVNGYFWTNIRRRPADQLHAAAKNKPVAYLLAFSSPSETVMNAWAVPEPLLYDSLSSLPLKKDKYSLEIFTSKQRIKDHPTSPDLTSYFQEFPLSQQELLLLKVSRDVDALVKKEKREAKMASSDVAHGIGEEDDVPPISNARDLLAIAEQQLNEAEIFNPLGISDARERTISSIVRRRGQPAFRLHLLSAYNGRCAITGCSLEPVLDAAHIIPYMGPETNHPGNGLLLRTDLHTLFDLKLFTIDVITMSVLVSPSLAGTCYAEYHGRRIQVPDDPPNWPSHEALEQHRRESGL